MATWIRCSVPSLGEQGAFDLVYEQLREPVFHQVATVLRDPAQSDEVSQEAFLMRPRPTASNWPAR